MTKPAVKRCSSFACVDFEASSLDEISYPIEVGLAIARDGAVDSWSSLIRPTSQWVRRDAWSRRSERVHGITREMLADAPTPAAVMAELNRRLAGFDQVHCDGGSYDEHWLSELADAAGIAPSFRLADSAALLDADAIRERFAALQASVPKPHRAGPDAGRLAALVAEARRA